MTTSQVFLYCRISADQQGRAEGVQAQESWGRAYAAETWPGVPVRVFADNDLSASKDDVHRPGFEAMRAALRRGECAGLWAVEQSRLTRIKTVWFELSAELIRAGIKVVHTRRNNVVPVDDVVSDILAILDANEVKKLRQRIIDKKEVLAKEGRPPGRLGYGYRQVIYTPDEERRIRAWQARRHEAKIRGEDMRVWKENNPRPQGGRPVLDEQGRRSAEVIPEEAEVIRECARRLLSGWGLKALATDLHSRGLRGKHGGRIVATSVADFLTAPCVAGLRVHHGEILGKATWEPILDEATWRSVCAVIKARKKTRRRSARVFLLAGYRFFCECGKPLQARSSGRAPDEPKVWSYYACEPSVTDGCGNATVDAESAESHIAVQLFKHLEELGAAGMLPTEGNAERRAEIVTELEGLDARRVELSEMWTARKVTTDQFRVMNAGLDDEERALQVELATLPAPTEKIDPQEIRAAWPEMPLDERRKLLDDWIERITLNRNGNYRLSAHRGPNQKDVAERAGVSQAYVSQVLRGKSRTPELATRVRAAMDELGYIPGAGKHRRPACNTDGIEITWR